MTARRDTRRIPAYALPAGAAVVVLLLVVFWRLRPVPEVTVRGTLEMRGESGSFTTCGERGLLQITDTNQILTRVYAELAGGPGRAVFVEARGVRRGNRLTLAQLRRMEPESRGCGEDADGWDYRAFGNEPFWAIEVQPQQIILTQPGVAPFVFPDRKVTVSGRDHIYTATLADRRVELVLTEQPCRHSMTGSYYSYTAAATIDGARVDGCAKDG